MNKIVYVLFCILLALTACSKSLVESQRAKQTLKPQEKVFVQLEAPYETLDACMELMPLLTKSLRAHGLVVSSSITVAETTEEVKQRHVKRLADFKADYVLKWHILPPEKHVFRNLKGTRQVKYTGKAQLELVAQSSGQIIWEAKVHTDKELYGYYYRSIVNRIISAMEQDNALVPSSL